MCINSDSGLLQDVPKKTTHKKAFFVGPLFVSFTLRNRKRKPNNCVMEKPFENKNVCSAIYVL